MSKAYELVPMCAELDRPLPHSLDDADTIAAAVVLHVCRSKLSTDPAEP
jgi:hypothetical protein